MRIFESCLALALPLALVWACGSSSGGADGATATIGGGGSATDGSHAFGGASLDMGGEGQEVASGGAGRSDGKGDGGSTAPGGSSVGGGVATGSSACSNGIDDDGDGLVDGFDPECTGPADDDEGSFATGIPGDNRDPKWQDCFFDGNSGAGDDRCRYATGCLTGELDRDDKDCALTDACIEFCAPLVPNGCDCFGCCSVQTADGGSIDIETSSSCSLDKLDDSEACPRCVKADACGNTCGRCELCPGKTLADLPADCGNDTGRGGAGSGGSTSNAGSNNGGGPSYTCDGGEQLCGPDLPSCGLGHYCALGCCLLQPPR